MRFSVAVPQYNRPEEFMELLAGPVEQSFQDVQVIVVEDGVERDARLPGIGETRPIPRPNPQPKA